MARQQLNQQTSTVILFVSDCVYIDTGLSQPYKIGRIEELIKNQNGSVDAKLVCFYRRTDMTPNLIVVADKHQSALEDERSGEEELTEKQRHQLKQKELFFSRSVETVPASFLRGKCTVSLLNEEEGWSSYLDRDDCFYYSLNYDTNQKTLCADKGEIRVGSRYQADTLPKKLEEGETCGRVFEDLEILEYDPTNSLTDEEIESYLTVAKSIGLYGRSIDLASSVKNPSLHMAAANSSRDHTVHYALKVLHQNNYDIAKSMMALIPDGKPVVCRDEFEEWSASEANLFEDGMEKYQKDFREIRKEFLNWKTQKNMVEFYYMWKTSDRHVQRKRIKAVEGEAKLKQIAFPANAMVNGHINGVDASTFVKPCQSCGKTQTSQWYAFGLPQSQNRLCNQCWSYWKKMGGMKYQAQGEVPSTLDLTPATVATNLSQVSTPVENGLFHCKECNKSFNRQERFAAHMANHAAGLLKCTMSGCSKMFKNRKHLANHLTTSHGVSPNQMMMGPMGSKGPMKSRNAFFLLTSMAMKISRRECPEHFRAKRSGRKPFIPINSVLIKKECASRFLAGTLNQERPKFTVAVRGKVVDVAHRLGTPLQECPEWLIALPKDQIPIPERLAFTPPPKDDRITTTSNTNTSLRKRSYEQVNGTIEGSNGTVPSKRRQLAPTQLQQTPNGGPNGKGSLSNGKSKMAMTRIGSRGRHLINWADAPDEVVFRANVQIKQMRRKFTASELKRGARKPWIRLNDKTAILGTNGN